MEDDKYYEGQEPTRDTQVFQQQDSNSRERKSHVQKMSEAMRKSTTRVHYQDQTKGSRISRIRNALDGDVRSSLDLSRSYHPGQEENLRDSYSFTRQIKQSSLTREQKRDRLAKSQHNRENEFQDRETGEITIVNMKSPMTQSLGVNALPAVTHNRFKRPKQQESLKNYQEKYNRLEQNFRRFTQNLAQKSLHQQRSRSSLRPHSVSPDKTIDYQEDREGVHFAYVGSVSPKPLNSRNNHQTVSTNSSNFYKAKEHHRNDLRQTGFQTEAETVVITNQNNNMAQLVRSSLKSPGGRLSTLRQSQLNKEGDLDRDMEAFSIADDVFGSWEAQHPRERMPRVQLLESIITRIQTFMDGCFTNLDKLCMSKQQSVQILSFKSEVAKQIGMTESILHKLQKEGQQPDSDSIYQAYTRALDCLDMAFKHAVDKLFSVENQTYMNHKFKEVAQAFEIILQESHRLNLYQLLPSLAESMQLMRTQTACALLKQQLVRHNERSMRYRFTAWRCRAGLTNYVSQNFRRQCLTRAILRIMKTKSKINLVRNLMVWKHVTQNRGTQIGRIHGEETCIVDSIFANSDQFNSCLQSDGGLSSIVRNAVNLALQQEGVPVMCDLVFIEGNEPSEQDEENSEARQTLIGYDPDTEQIIRQVSLDMVEGSLTSCSLNGTTLVDGIYSQDQFNELIDGPLFSEDQKDEWNHFSELNMLAVPLRPTLEEGEQVRGILRLFSPGKITADNFRAIEYLGGSFGNFFERIQQIRWQLGCLQDDIRSKQEQQAGDLFERVAFNAVFELLSHLSTNPSKADFLDQVEIKLSLIANDLMPGQKLRQIFFHEKQKADSNTLQRTITKSLLQESAQDALIKPKSHQEEGHRELLEDFLDYRNDYMVQQLSIEIDTLPFGFIFHRHLAKDVSRQSASINQNQLKALTFLVKVIQPVMTQSQVVFDELTTRVQSQASVLHRQLKLNSIGESLRSQLTKLSQFQVQSEACIYLQNVLATVLVSSDSLLFFRHEEPATENEPASPHINLLNYACALNAGVLTGEPLSRSVLVAYLNKQQNQLLEMTEIVSPTEDTIEVDAVQRYETSIRDFYSYKQEFTVKNGGSQVYFKLPIFCERELIAVFCAELSLMDSTTDYTEHQEMVDQLKYLLKTIQQEASVVLAQSVHQQTSQTSQFRECFEQLQGQVSNLTLDVEFLQSTQRFLVLPFTQTPSARVLGISLTQILAHMMPNLHLQAIGLAHEDRIEVPDIRLLDWKVFNRFTEGEDLYDLRLPEKSLTFNLDDRIIQLVLEGGTPQQSLVLRMLVPLIDVSQQESPRIADIEETALLSQCEIFQMVVQPFVREAMRTLTQTSFVSIQQQQLPRLLENLFLKKTFSHTYSFFSTVRDFKINKVPIFTRLRSYQKIVKTVVDQESIYEDCGYGQEAQADYLVRSKVHEIYSHAFDKMNFFALRFKQQYWNRYKLFVYNDTVREEEEAAQLQQWKPTKLQRKATSTFCRLSKRLLAKYSFARWAVKAQLFHRLNNPDTRSFAAAMCIVFNQKRIKKRQAFQRLRANASDRVYRDFSSMESKDRAFLTKQVQKYLLRANLNCQSGSQNLERALQSVIERSAGYLQQTLSPEQLDLMLITVRQPPQGSKAHAYVFNNRLDGPKQPWQCRDPQKEREVQRVNQVVDHVQTKYIGQLVENLAGFGDFELSFKRDIILQMLSKSQTMFNFGDIKHSLYDLYANTLGKSGDSLDETNARLVMLQKCKSALVIPMQQAIQNEETDDYEEPIWQPQNATLTEHTASNPFDERKLEDFTLGSIELYRFHQQSFDADIERRMQIFARIFSFDVLPVYYRLRETLNQMQILRQRAALSQTIPIVIPSLSSLLRSVHFNAPTQLQATQVLPILVGKTPYAYFYQFKDNHIYSFAYRDTFVKELVDFSCILEVSAATNGTRANRKIEETSHLPGHRHRTVDAGLVKSVTNAPFSHIIYYPVMCDVPLVNSDRPRAILEVSFQSQEQIPRLVMSDQIQTFLNQFSTQLQAQERRMSAFCRLTEGFLGKKRAIHKARALQVWRSNAQLIHQKRNFIQNHEQAISQTELCFNDYVRNMENFDGEMRNVAAERDQLTVEVCQLKADSWEKHRYFGASIILLRNMLRQATQKRTKEYFLRWKFYQKVTKVAESAFNKILELNHRHSERRFTTAAKLLSKNVCHRQKKLAMDNLFSFVQMQQLRLTGGLLSSRSKHSGDPMLLGSATLNGGSGTIRGLGSAAKQYLLTSQGLNSQNSNYMAAAHEPFSNIIQQNKLTSAHYMNKSSIVSSMAMSPGAVQHPTNISYIAPFSAANETIPIATIEHPIENLQKTQLQQSLSFGAVPSQGQTSTVRHTKGSSKRTSAERSKPRKTVQRSNSNKRRLIH